MNLLLKIGATVLLLRNPEPPKLCIEIRLVVKKLLTHVIEANILKGCGLGEDVFTPRILRIPSGAEIPLLCRDINFH